MQPPEIFEEHLHNTRFKPLELIKQKLLKVYICSIVLISIFSIFAYGVIVFKYCKEHTFRENSFLTTYLNPPDVLIPGLGLISCLWFGISVFLGVYLFLKFDNFKTASNRQVNMDQISRMEYMQFRHPKFSQIVLERIRKNGFFSDLDYKVTKIDHYFEMENNQEHESET